MIYDVVIIGAGLAGFSAALAGIKAKKKVMVVAKGMGSLYSASGHIDILGYLPANNNPVSNPLSKLQSLMAEEKDHPYSKVGEEGIREAFATFLTASREMGLPYAGSLDKNMMMPTALGALVPTALYPETCGKNILDYRDLVVVGIKELVDFYPHFCADNMTRVLKRKITTVEVELGLDIKRELNSFDIALLLEKKEIRARIVNQLKAKGVKDCLVLYPAVLGVNRWQEVIAELESEIQCPVLEIPTLPPSVMGYRLAEIFKKYLQDQGVEFLMGFPVSHVDCQGGYCREVGIYTANGRLKMIKGQNFCLATGGILGEGLQVLPRGMREEVFNLPVNVSQKNIPQEFFSLEGQPLSYSGIAVNNQLQPITPGTKEVILKNVFIAGATLAGYDPFVEKSGNGVALATGYTAGVLAAGGGTFNG